MKKITAATWMFMSLYFFTGAQDVTLSGPGPCNAGAVSGTFTVPCNVTAISIQVYGAGGGAGGGGGGSNGGFFNTRGGGGAGGGGYTTRTINVTPGSSFSYSIGGGGCGGSNGSDGSGGGNGNAGGNSTFTGTDAGGTPVSLTANGGARGTGGSGTGGSTGSGGIGGSASGGTTNTSGTGGNNGSGGNGGIGGSNQGPSGGAGGASTSAAGNTYGGAGAGGGDSQGGRGAAGGILITYTATITIPTPTISTTPPTCTTEGSSTISNYDGAMTYIFSPAGPSAGAGGVISGMVTSTSYTVVASDAGCDSPPSLSFSNAPATPLPVPTISTAPPTCTADGSSSISNYDGAMTYLFSPAGPSAGAGGVISGMVIATSYTVEATDGSCTSAPSASFSIDAQLPAPVASISGLLSYCTGSNTTLTADGGTSYAWTDAGANNIGNSASVTVTQGDYTAVVTDGNGCTASATATVTETAGPSITLTASPIQICTGQSVTFTATLPGHDAYDFLLNGVSVQNSASDTYTTTTLIQGDIVTARASALGCFGPESNPIAVTVLQIGTATVTLSVAPGSICLGQNVTFTASPPGFLLYEFLVNGTVVQTDVSNTYSTTTIIQGDVVTARASDLLCFGPLSNPVSVTILQIGTAVVSLSASEDTICLGQPVTFTATPPGFAEYEFIRNGSAVQSNASNTYTTSTLLQIDTLTVRASSQGCFGPISNQVHVFVISTLAVNAGLGIVNCLNDPPVTLQGFSPTGGTWTGTGITNPSGIFNPQTAGSGTNTLTYSVTDANGCSGDDAISAEVYSPAQTNFSAAPTIMELADSTLVVFTDLSAGAVSWQWDFGDERTSTLQNPSHTYSDTGSYTITLITTDVNGCTDTFIRTNYILVTGVVSVFVPNAFTPNNDAVNDVLLVYGKGIDRIVFEIYNRWGEMVFQSRSMSDGWDGTYRGKTLPPDVYIYTLYAEFTNRTSKRLKGSVTLLK